MAFWICAAILLGIAAFWLSQPLASKISPKLESAHERIIAIAKERRNEIHSAFESGDLNTKEHAQAMTDLEVALADELSTSKELGETTDKSPKFSTPVILLSLPIVAISMYALTGTSDYPLQAQQAKAIQFAQTTADEPASGVPSLEQLVVGLGAQLQQNPNDERGLFLLGQTYSRIGRHAESAEVYGKLLALVGPNPDLLTERADAIVMSNNRGFSEDSTALLKQAIELDPHHIKARWLAGLAALEFGRAELALEHWLWAKAELTGDPSGSLQIAQLIDSAKQQLGNQTEQIETRAIDKIAQHNQSAEHLATAGESASTPNTEDADNPIELTIKVSISEDARSIASPEDIVFIFVKAQTGSKAPLAVERLHVADLPTTVTLDDSKAMLPQMKLSLFEDVTISARISKTGQAIAQAGDIESGSINTKNSHNELLSLTISDVVE